MKKTTRCLLLIMAAIMIFSAMPFSAFAETSTADAVINVGDSKTVTLNGPEVITFQFTAPEDGNYVIWSEADYSDDLCVTLYDEDGIYLDDNDDALYEKLFLNFKLVCEANADETYYFEVKSYSGEDKVTAPVYLDKAVEATGIEVISKFHPVLNVVGSSMNLDYKLVPANAIGEPIIVESSDYDIIEADTWGVEYVSTGEATVTLSLENRPEIKTVLDITVTEPASTKIALNETTDFAINSYYKFTAPEDGDYAVFTSNPDIRFDVDFEDYRGRALVSLTKGESVLIRRSLGGIAKSRAIGSIGVLGAVIPCDLSVKKVTEDKTFELNAYTYMLGSYKEEDVIYPKQEIDIKAVLTDPASSHELDVTFEIEGDGCDILYTETDLITVMFEKAGNYKVTAVDDGGNKVEKTFVVSEFPKVTLEKPYVYTAENDLFSGALPIGGFPVAFTSPKDGEYFVEVTNDSGFVNTIAPIGFEGEPQNCTGGFLAKDDTIDMAVVYIPSSELSLLKTGKVTFTVTVKEWVEPTDISVPEKVTVGVGQTKLIDITPVPQNSDINYSLLEVDASENIYAGFYNGKLRIEAGDTTGDATVEISSLIGEVTKTIEIEITDAKKIELDVPFVVADDIEKDFAVFTAPEEGYYTFRVNNALAECGYGMICDGLDGIFKYMYPDSTSIYLEKDEERQVQLLPYGDGASITVSKSKQATKVSVPGGIIFATLGAETYIDAIGGSIRFEPEGAIPQEINKITFADDSYAIRYYDAIIGIKVGSTTVEIETEGGLKTTAKLIVTDKTPVIPSDLYLNKEELTLEEGTSEKLIATAKLVKDAKFYWSSSDESVAKVDENGNVSAVGVGTATISANYYGIVIECEVTVTEKTTPPVEIKDTTKIFKDVTAGKWYVNAINYAVSYGIFSGTSETTFEPEKYMTRAQFVQVFANLSGYDTSDRNVDSGFADVPKGKWFTSAVTWAAKNGIVNGVGGGKFEPNTNVTREQMCVMLVNFVEKYKKETLKTQISASKFADDASIASWAKTAVYKCADAKLVNGVGDNKFDPKSSATRAQGATLFSNFHKEYLK